LDRARARGPPLAGGRTRLHSRRGVVVRVRVVWGEGVVGVRRELGHVTAYEFRAKDQPTLLREIATWLARLHKTHPLPSFLLGIYCDIQEEDLPEPEPYSAIVYLDGPLTGSAKK
jgi:hypothetical protein